jgi:hypothetical protein
VRGKPLLAPLFLMLAGMAGAQDMEPRGAYLIPQTIFVGDKGRLVTPLGQAFQGAMPFVREGPGTPAPGEEILISRMEMEHRNGTARLLIDFIPYAPGIIELPPLELPAVQDEPLVITGLKVPVASILDSSSMALSPKAPPMAAPGTSFLIYGSSVLILLLLLGIGGGVMGRSRLGRLREGFRRRRLIRAMERILRRGRARFHQNPLSPLEQREFLRGLVGEFRKFLTLYTGINYHSLTPSEIGSLPGAASLGGLFRRWDALRFSGHAPAEGEILSTLDEAGAFIAVLAENLAGGEGAALPAALPAAGEGRAGCA